MGNWGLGLGSVVRVKVRVKVRAKARVKARVRVRVKARVRVRVRVRRVAHLGGQFVEAETHRAAPGQG